MLTTHIRSGLALLRPIGELDTVSYGANTLTIAHLSRRRGALAVLVRCNLFEERYDLADYPICVLSSAASVACGIEEGDTAEDG